MNIMIDVFEEELNRRGYVRIDGHKYNPGTLARVLHRERFEEEFLAWLDRETATSNLLQIEVEGELIYLVNPAGGKDR